MGIAAAVYRAKMKPIATARPTPAPVVSGSPAAPTPTPAEEKEDPTLHVRGPRGAPVTMEVYADFQCPSCAHASLAISELEKEYGDQLRLIYYEFPLEMHKHAVEAARAAEAAGVQGKFWEMHDQLYKNQEVWSKVSNVKPFFEAYAEAIGLDVARFRADEQSPDVQLMVINQGEAGAARGVQNTPTIFVNGTQMRGAFTLESIRNAIEAALAEKRKT